MGNKVERLRSNRRKAFGEWLSRQRGSHSGQWLADQLGVKRNTISDYETGKDTPSPIRLALIASLFHADIPELSKIARRKEADVQNCFDYVANSQLSIQDFNKQALVEIYNAKEFREFGNIPNALEMLDFWISKIEDRISLNKDNLKDILELKKIAAKGYVERMACKSEIQPHESIITEITADYAKAVNYSMAAKDQSTLGWANSRFASGQYVAFNYTKSISLAQKALLYCPGDPSLRAEALRDLFLDYAYSEQPGLAQKTEDQAIRDLDTGVISSPKDRAGLFEAISRGHAILAKAGASQMMDSAKKEMKILEGQKQVKLIRDLQIMRSELITLEEYKRRGLSIDKQLATEIANRGLALADQHGYLRYQREFKLLSKILGLPAILHSEMSFQPALF